MAQLVKVLAGMPDSLSLVPRTDMMEGESHRCTFSLTSTHALWHRHNTFIPTCRERGTETETDRDTETERQKQRDWGRERNIKKFITSQGQGTVFAFSLELKCLHVGVILKWTKESYIRSGHHLHMKIHQRKKGSFVFFIDPLAASTTFP